MNYILNISNIEFIKKEVAGSGLTYSHLMDELIDHVCCDVEQEMRNGLSFAKAYEMVKTKIGMEGLERIQHETLYLIDKKYRIMKNIMKFSGLAAPIVLAFGSLFKIQHWPGAGVMFVFGFFLLCFIFLPSAIYVSYKEVSNFTRKWTHIVGFLGTFFISIGFLFKVQHWPFAGIALTIGIIVSCLLFLPMVLRNQLKDRNNPVPKFVFVIAFAGFMGDLAGFLLKIMHWPGAGVIMIAGCILLVIVAFPLYVYHAYKDRLHIANSFVFILIVMIWYIIPITLISLNLSREVLSNVYEQNQSLKNDLEFLEEINLVTVEGIKDNQSVYIVNDQSRSLMEFIGEMKVKLQDHKMPDSVEMIQLTNRVNAYESQLMSLVNDEKYRAVISRTLEEPSGLRDQPFDNPDLLLNHLIFLQMNIGIAEQTALKHLQMKNSQAIQAINK